MDNRQVRNVMFAMRYYATAWVKNADEAGMAAKASDPLYEIASEL
jgi:hypothetical protein